MTVLDVRIYVVMQYERERHTRLAWLSYYCLLRWQSSAARIPRPTAYVAVPLVCSRAA